jgi:hypothetical protein
VVDDHIRRLTDEDAARRAERELARRRFPSAARDDATFDVEAHSFAVPAVAAPRAAGPSTRARFGRWLMGVGTAIAGNDAVMSDAVRRAATGTGKGPCDDSSAMPRAV